MSDPRRLATATGFVGPTLVIGSILLATLLAPPETFTWRDRALSDLGRPDAPTFWLFNGALVVGGAVAAPFCWRMWIGARNALERIGTLALAVALVGMALVGVFFLEHTDYYLRTDLHGAAALCYFVTAPIAQAVYGAGAYRAGDRRWGLLTVGVGVAHVPTWLAWIAYSRTLAADPGAWFALPEMGAAALVAGWIALLAARFWRVDGPGAAVRSGAHNA